MVREAGKAKKELKKEFSKAAKATGQLTKVLQDIASYVNQAVNKAAAEFQGEFVEAAANTLACNYPQSILPEGTRYCQFGINYCMLVIEQKPMVRQLHFEEYEKGSYRLALPYMVFMPIFVRENGLWTLPHVPVGCRNEPLKSLDDILCHPPLPNMGNKHPDGTYTDLTMCIMNLEDEFYAADDDSFLAKGWQCVHDHFWQASFNMQMNHYFLRYRREHKMLVSLPAWEEHSLKDSTFILRLDWQKSISVRKCLTDAFENWDAAKTSKKLNATINPICAAAYKQAMIYWLTDTKKISNKIVEIATDAVQHKMEDFCSELADGIGAVSTPIIANHIALCIKKAMENN